MCSLFKLYCWPAWWWAAYAAGALDGISMQLGAPQSVPSGCNWKRTVRTPLLKLHVSQLRLRPGPPPCPKSGMSRLWLVRRG